MSEVLDVHTPAAETAITPPAESTPLSDRERIYQKFYPQPASASVESVGAEPAVAAEPVVAQPAPAQTQPSDLQTLMEEVRSLREQVSSRLPAPVVAAEITPESWLKLLADGKVSEGEAALARRMEAELSAKIEQRTIERLNVERHITSINEAARSANPEIVPMENYISFGIQSRLNAAVNAGQIKTPADYVTVYQSALTAEIEKARQLIQTYRGAGKTEAAVRQREVVSAQPIQPNTVTQNRETQSGPPAAESYDDYMSKRKSQSMSGRGLGA